MGERWSCIEPSVGQLPHPLENVAGLRRSIRCTLTRHRRETLGAFYQGPFRGSVTLSEVGLEAAGTL